MSELTLKPAVTEAEKSHSVPSLDNAGSGTYRKLPGGRNARRRFNASRLGQASDNGLRLFRVY